jgi:hypothetical protein
MHIGYISMVVKLLCIFSMLLVFFAEASDDRLVIDIFDRKIELPSDCVKNTKRSSDKEMHYFCTGSDTFSEMAQLIYAEFDGIDYPKLISDAEEELGLISNVYMLNEFEVFELKQHYDKSVSNVLTSICSASFCISIFGNYQNVVSDVKRQLR